MVKLLSWMLGLGLGAAVGALLVMLFSPASGQEITASLRKSWQATLDDARQANAKRQADLEAELAQMQQKYR